MKIRTKLVNRTRATIYLNVTVIIKIRLKQLILSFILLDYEVCSITK